MFTYGSLAAQIDLAHDAAHGGTDVVPLPFPIDLLLGHGHIVADGEEWVAPADAFRCEPITPAEYAA